MRVGQKPLCDISQSKLNTQVILIFPSVLCLGEGMWRRILVEGYGSVGLGVSGVSQFEMEGKCLQQRCLSVFKFSRQVQSSAQEE